MKIFDSNIWIAYFHEIDSQHGKALKLFNSSRYPIAITEYVVVETCNILLAKATKEIADLFINYVLDNEDVVLLLSDSSLFFETIGCFLEKDKKGLSFVDLSLVCLGKKHKIMTFDKKLNNEISRRSSRKRKKIKK